jgi:hypothetical protein
MIPSDVSAVATPRDRQKEFDWAGLWLEAAGIVALLAVTAFYLVTSWRKWNHPLIDFGRELYIPWRLSEGAVLYRDVDDVYGPLSQYFNAGLFRLFGPGMMVLVTANLVVFAAILALSYALFRRAWGVAGALTACLVFVSIFGFSQFLVCSNFNYATPYAHEATHGVLVCLALVAALSSWLDRPSGRMSFGAGLLAGLTLVIKPEFIVAGGAATLAAGVMQWRRLGKIPATCLASFALGVVLPTAAFAAYFSQHFLLLKAVDAACRAWSSLIIHPDIVSKQYQLGFLGLDQPWINLVAHGRKTMFAVVTLGVLGGMVAFALKRTNVAARWSLVLLTAAAALAVGQKAMWGDIGRCLLGLNLLYLGLALSGRLRRLSSGEVADAGGINRRILLGVLATALMSRMFLSGRIFQYGFYQAALAAMVVVAVVCSESAEWMPAVRSRRLAVAAIALALLVPGIGGLTAVSQRYLKVQTYAVGEGRDRFYTLPPNLDASGHVINLVVEVLRGFPPGSVLLALPEAEMINYLARMRSPLPQFQFYSWATEGGRERTLVAALEARPPDLVVIASRDLNDFGIARYGDREGAGREIVQWLASHYRVTHHFGDDPLISNQRGAYVMQRMSVEPANSR